MTRRPPRAGVAACLLIIVAGLLGGCGSQAAGGTSARPPVAPSETPAPTIPPSPFTPGGDLLTTPGPTPGSAPTVAPSGAPASISVIAPAPPTAVRPNRQLTPGSVSGDGADQVCRGGYASGHRHVGRQQYVDVYAAYHLGYPQPPGMYELDHLVPLELGGDNSDSNLWPQPASPAPGYHEKDVLETRLHDLVCSGRLDLATAQGAIASDWYRALQTYVGPAGDGSSAGGGQQGG